MRLHAHCDRDTVVREGRGSGCRYIDASKGGLQAAKYDVPRLAEGKYLKLLDELFDDAGVLSVTEDDLRARFCPECDLGPICRKERSEGELSPLCLDGFATAVLRSPG